MLPLRLVPHPQGRVVTGPRMPNHNGSGDWRDRAACLETEPELFFATTPGAIAEAQAVCFYCPVAAECLADAGQYGIWGGLTEDERHALRGRRTTRPTTHARCGTYSGVSRHRRAGEALCADCKQARCDYEARRRTQRREAASA